MTAMLKIMGVILLYGLVAQQFQVNGSQVSSNLLRADDVVSFALFEQEPMASNPVLPEKAERDPFAHSDFKQGGTRRKLNSRHVLSLSSKIEWNGEMELSEIVDVNKSRDDVAVPVGRMRFEKARFPDLKSSE